MSIYVIAEYLRLSSEDVDLKNTQKTAYQTSGIS